MKTSPKIIPPTAKFHIGDRVNVRCEEAGYPPFFPAIVIGIRGGIAGEKLDYTIYDEDSGIKLDGYTEDWLTKRLSESEVAEISRRLEDKLEWEYTRTGRCHRVDDGERPFLFKIKPCAEYGFIHDKKDGYDLFKRDQKIAHGKTVKELKEKAEKFRFDNPSPIPA